MCVNDLFKEFLERYFEDGIEEHIVSTKEISSFQQKVFRITYISHDNETKKIKKKKHNLKKTVFLKVYLNNMSWWSFLDQNIKDRELTAYQILRNNGANDYIPKILLEDVGLVLLQRIPGKQGSKFALKYPEQFIKESARVLAKIHSIPINGDASPKLSTDALGNATLDYLGKVLAWTSPNQFDIGKIQERVPSLIHGDFHEDNMLFKVFTNDVGVNSKELRLTGVIDWEEAAYGDSHIDLANFCRTIARLYKKDTAKIREYLLLFLTTYEELIGWRPSNICFWNDLIISRNRNINLWVSLNKVTWDPLSIKDYDMKEHLSTPELEMYL